MSNIVKCVESYFDSSKYEQKEIMEKLYKEAKTYRKKFEINIELNQWGVYVAKLVVYDKTSFLKNNEIFKFKQFKSNRRKMTKREKYSSKSYGKYKRTGNYKPCIY